MSNHPQHMRTELRRVRYLGSARSGTTGSIHMRLTSLALVPLRSPTTREPSFSFGPVISGDPSRSSPGLRGNGRSASG